MTKVKFYIGDNRLNGFEIKGHSGYAEQGEDIVCAAISSAALMTANTITEVIGDKASIKESDGLLKLKVENPDEKTVALLEGLKLHLTEISKQYPQFIKIIDGGTKNA